MSFRVEYRNNVFSFRGYPFKFPDLGNGVRIDDIEEVHLDRHPIELWLKSGDIVFFPVRQAHLLYEIHLKRALPITWRTNLWDYLLRPFLYTEPSPEERAQIDGCLQEEGFSEDEIRRLRRWASPVKWFALLVWDEWMDLDLYNLLIACQCGPILRCFARRPTYEKAIAVARRGKSVPAPPGVDPFGQYSQVKLHRYWNETVKSIAPNPDDADEAFEVLDKILEHYQGPYSFYDESRSYHNLSHLLGVLDTLKSLGAEPAAKPTLWLAAFFHDYLYSPRARDNEEKSAEEALRLLRNWRLEEGQKQEIKELILCTKDHLGNPRDGDFGFLSDGDLKIFSKSWLEYTSLTMGIYKEYAGVPWIAFRAGRIRFLEKLKAQAEEQGMFVHLGAEADLQALRNIEKELKLLRRSSRFKRKHVVLFFPIEPPRDSE